MLLNSVLNPPALPNPTGEWEPTFGHHQRVKMKCAWFMGRRSTLWLTATFSLKKGKDNSA